MRTYLISYDLSFPGQNYTELHEAIKRIANGWWHNLESVWIIGHTGPAAQIRDIVVRSVDMNDKLIVIELGTDWASFNLPPSGAHWLVQHVEAA